jgi:ribokinase
MKYVVVGGLSLDHVVNSRGETMLDQFGGNAAYAAAGVRIWAAGEIGMVARRGDGFATNWLDGAERAGIDTSGVTRVPAPHGLHGGMVYDERGNRDDYVARDKVAATPGRGEGATENPLTLHRAQMDFGADATDIPPAYNDAEAVHLAPRYLRKQLSVLRHYRNLNPNVIIIADPITFSMQLEREDELRELFSLVDAILPSEIELELLFGPVDPLEGAKLLASFGACVVVVKLGRMGCLVYQNKLDRVDRIPICPVPARDPTGAGDSFCGGFLVGLRETGDPVEAAVYGTVSSSFVVEGFGADFTYSIERKAAEERAATLRSTL